MTPIALSFLSSKSNWTYWDAIGILLYMLGMTGVLVLDQQMVRFRRNLNNFDNVGDMVLWGYSRHPNYFFESVIWISYTVIGMNYYLGLTGRTSPAVIIICILKITGVHSKEKRLIATKGNAYREYQRITSVFIPKLPRSKR